MIPRHVEAPLIWWLVFLLLLSTRPWWGTHATGCEDTWSVARLGRDEAERLCTLHPRCVWNSTADVCLTLPSACAARDVSLCEHDSGCAWEATGCTAQDTSHAWWALCDARHPAAAEHPGGVFDACHRNHSDDNPCLWNTRVGRCEPEPARLCPQITDAAQCTRTPNCGWDEGSARCRGLSLFGRWCPLADHTDAVACSLALTDVPYECHYETDHNRCEPQHRARLSPLTWVVFQEAFCDRTYQAPLGAVVPCQWSGNATQQQRCLAGCPARSGCEPYPRTLTVPHLDLPLCGVAPELGGCSRAHDSTLHCTALGPFCVWSRAHQTCRALSAAEVDEGHIDERYLSQRERWAREDMRDRAGVVWGWALLASGFLTALSCFVLCCVHAAHPEWFGHRSLAEWHALGPEAATQSGVQTQGRLSRPGTSKGTSNGAPGVHVQSLTRRAARRLYRSQ